MTADCIKTKENHTNVEEIIKNRILYSFSFQIFNVFFFGNFEFIIRFFTFTSLASTKKGAYMMKNGRKKNKTSHE